MDEQDNPLIKALPPASDYLTYLTIIEYNLSLKNLPILHKVLQDVTLTTHIGWDLVHLLVPYLPESQQCLQDVARLGNPREVILKVTESLRLIDYDALAINEEDPATGPGASKGPLQPDSSTFPLKTAPVQDTAQKDSSSQAIEFPSPLPPGPRQFVALLSMLTILHPRIKTKRPSRFLSTTLQAVLASFSNSTTDREEMILAIVSFVKAVAGTKRPPLPSRRSGGSSASFRATVQAETSAADPEAGTDTKPSPEDTTIRNKLLQSFITHVVEEYMLNLSSAEEDVPGMAWCSRIQEKLHPERIIPETTTFASRFANEEELHHRIDAVGQLVTVAKDLSLADEDLLAAAMTIESVPSQHERDEDEPPASAEEIPLSRLGSLMLYVARQVSGILYGSTRPNSSLPFAIFPDHQELLRHCLSSPENGTGTLGTEPESLIDAALALGLVTLEYDSIGEPTTDEQFKEYLQLTALLSSNCPSGNLRGHAHYLTTTILRSQPNDNVRLDFIRDTLEHCPFENLKVSAVGWIKGETIEANPPSPEVADQNTADSLGEGPSIFATPFALDSLGPFLFPSLQNELLKPAVREAWLTFRTNFSFYLAALNFAYLLLCAKHLHQVLSTGDLWSSNDVAGSFCQPLREASDRFKKAMADGGGLADEKSGETLAELNVLDQALERVTAAVKFLNE